jgi:hypothetical protein
MCHVNITWQAAPRGMNSSMMRTRQPFDSTGFPTSNRFRTIDESQGLVQTLDWTIEFEFTLNGATMSDR